MEFVSTVVLTVVLVLPQKPLPFPFLSFPFLLFFSMFTLKCMCVQLYKLKWQSLMITVFPAPKIVE